MANQKEKEDRRQLLESIVLEKGFTKKSHLIRYIRKKSKQPKDLNKLSDVQLIRIKDLNKLSDVQLRRDIFIPSYEDIIDENHYIKGRSIHKNKNGQVISEWVKTDTNKGLIEKKFKQRLDALKEDIKPYKPVNLLEIDRSPKLINQYTITDYHLGMFSWAEESGTEWSSEIAEDTLVRWFEKAIQTSPKAKKCIFAQLGDFMHFDGLEAVTPQSKHVLDSDIRYQNLVRMAMRVIRRIVEMLLVKYEEVHLINVEGNHDMASSAWLKEVFYSLYENEPRVIVDTNPSPYHCYTQGNLCLFYAHSHTKKMGSLDSVFVGNYKKEFGLSEYVYGHTGHLHHKTVLESNLMIIEQHATLSAKDAYSSRGGYLSKRNASVITYHENYGEVGRNIISPQMLK